MISLGSILAVTIAGTSGLATSSEIRSGSDKNSNSHSHSLLDQMRNISGMRCMKEASRLGEFTRRLHCNSFRIASHAPQRTTTSKLSLTPLTPQRPFQTPTLCASIHHSPLSLHQGSKDEPCQHPEVPAEAIEYAPPQEQSPSESIPTVTLNDKKVPLGKLSSPPRLLIGFTCKVCSHRQHNYMSKKAYQTGVVIIKCDGCSNLHLIADHLGWYDSQNPPGTIEQILKRKRDAEDAERDKSV